MTWSLFASACIGPEPTSSVGAGSAGSVDGGDGPTGGGGGSNDYASRGNGGAVAAKGGGGGQGASGSLGAAGNSTWATAGEGASSGVGGTTGAAAIGGSEGVAGIGGAAAAGTSGAAGQVSDQCVTYADCSALGNNYQCVNHVCTVCPEVTDGTYYVDPANGNDGSGTGSRASTGCAFKTMTRAIAAIGAAPTPGTRLFVLATATISAGTNGETFPIDVPANLSIIGSEGRPQLSLAANTVGFVLHQPAVVLSNLSIDGNNHSGLSGVSVTTGATASTTVGALDVKNMGREGIAVLGDATLTMLAGVQSSYSGTATNPADGLRVADRAHVILAVEAGAPAHFDSNTGYGIHVMASGSIELAATPATGGAGTVTTNNNGGSGLRIEQTPGAAVPPNTVSGLVSYANTGDGIRVGGGSSLVLRGSYILANGANGVMVSTFVSGTTRNNDTSQIDLGTSSGAGYGHNTVQGSTRQNPNAGAGICLAVDGAAGSQLRAAGNIFAGPIDCSTSTATLMTSRRCSRAVDYAVQTTTTSTTNRVIVSNCQ